MKAATGLAATILLGACTATRMERNLEANVAEQKREFQDILGTFKSGRSRPISWNSAYKRMMRDNLSLKQSRLQVEESKKQRKRQWLSLVPRVTSYVNIGANLSELSDLGSDDLNASLLASFDIPNPFEFYAGLYAASLQEQNAIWSHELDERRAYSQLYSAFVEGEAIAEADEAYKSRMNSLLGNSSGDLDNVLKSVTSEMEGLKRRRLYQRLNLNQLLNTPGSNWESTGPLPKISYENRYRRLVTGEGFGKLALNLQAIQIEGAILRVQQVKFQQWPSINFGLSTPPIYSSSGTTDFSSDNLQLFTGAYKSFDVTDLGGREKIQDAKARLRFTRQQLRQRAETEGSRILQLVESYDGLMREKQRLRKRVGRLNHGGSNEPEAVIADLELHTETNIRLIEVRRQIQQLDLQFLVWDENFWN